MTRTVHVLGGFQTDFARKAGAGGIYALLRDLVPQALAEADVDACEIETAHVGNLAGELYENQAHLGAMLVSIDPAFHGLPASRHEAACASGSMALLAAMAEIEAGRYDVALVCGVEVMRNVPAARAAELLRCAAWADREVVDEDFPWPTQFAEIADEYDGRYGLRHEHLARIVEINFENASRNPNAQTREWDRPVSFGAHDANPVVRGLLRKNDCGRITDGAAAVVVASDEFAAEWCARGPTDRVAPAISGWGHRTAPLALSDKLRARPDDPLVFPHVRDAVQDALRRADLPDVWAVDALEVHDCFSISEYAAIDHAGLTPPGMGWQAIEDGVIEATGRLPINPSGGLLGLGHPVGATGVRMVLDAWKQVTDGAGDYQVDGARTVLTLNIGGSFSTVASFVVAA
ncbi:MAG: acetyl-CoA acetyltransferase [Acidimicrobiaceae bacterium]|nr:acetyl-CoA acetyltransferase [Acidimicrobiaceae bacterium]